MYDEKSCLEGFFFLGKIEIGEQQFSYINVGGGLDVILCYCRLPTIQRYIVKLKFNILHFLLFHLIQLFRANC